MEVLRFAGSGRGTGQGGLVLGSHLTAGVGSARAPPSPPWEGLADLGSEAKARVHAALCWGGLSLSQEPVSGSQRLRLPEQLPALPCGRAILLQHELLRFLWPSSQ